MISKMLDMESLSRDRLAKNLISQLLLKDPKRRSNTEQILDHPFVSHKKVTRLVGQEVINPK